MSYGIGIVRFLSVTLRMDAYDPLREVSILIGQWQFSMLLHILLFYMTPFQLYMVVTNSC